MRDSITNVIAMILRYFLIGFALLQGVYWSARLTPSKKNPKTQPIIVQIESSMQAPVAPMMGEIQR